MNSTLSVVLLFLATVLAVADSDPVTQYFRARFYLDESCSKPVGKASTVYLNVISDLSLLRDESTYNPIVQSQPLSMGSLLVINIPVGTHAIFIASTTRGAYGNPTSTQFHINLASNPIQHYFNFKTGYDFGGYIHSIMNKTYTYPYGADMCHSVKFSPHTCWLTNARTTPCPGTTNDCTPFLGSSPLPIAKYVNSLQSSLYEMAPYATGWKVYQGAAVTEARYFCAHDLILTYDVSINCPAPLP